MVRKFTEITAALLIACLEIIGIIAFTSGFAESSTPLKPVSYGYAPYAYVAHGNITMSDYMQATGTKFFWASFVQSVPSKCSPAWAGEAANSVTLSLRAGAISDDIMRVREGGGSVGISFGGAAGDDLAVACTSLYNLTSAYRTVIHQYQINDINFDIEGSGASDPSADVRRIQAAYILQRENPSLNVTLTLASSPYGLSNTTLAMVKHYRDAGVTLSGIFIMTSDYGPQVKTLGPAITQSANALFTQLKSLYVGMPDATIWHAIGLIPELGLNTGYPVNSAFTLDDALTLHNFAESYGIGTISDWAANRDKSCRDNNVVVAIDCSGIVQQANQFQQILTPTPQPQQ